MATVGTETTAKPMDGRARRKLATREALRSATLELALERGLDAVPVEEIATRAGVSTRTFFNYFETKEDAALLDLPRVGDEELARMAGGRGAAGLWTELAEMFAADADRVEHESPDLPRLLLLHAQTPTLAARQGGQLRRFESRLVEVVMVRLGGDPTARMQAELIAGAALIATRIAFDHWNDDERRRPAASYTRSAFALLADAFASAK
ncbi:TetR/AcrR family transcriptional regulator [Nocardia miyunensis]|uniref:TetR/AcrR family transcriptional regulator n=1 Tax=Nocardia miyunensis TaxID=282684 RepID=UPI00082AE992|nr:TetR/AcrR family transcriptional regulator [Nocardia miyunensis]